MNSESLEDLAPAQRIDDRVRRHRRELMAMEFEQIALDLFAERGYTNVSVDDIAEVAGVSARTFYRYFAAKEDVLTAFPGRMGAAIRDALSQETDDRPLFEALRSAVLRSVKSLDLEEYRRWLTVVEGLRPHAPVIKTVTALQQDFEPLLQNRTNRSARAARQVQVILAASQAAFAAAARSWYADGGDFPTLVREAFDLLANGFAVL